MLRIISLWGGSGQLFAAEPVEDLDNVNEFHDQSAVGEAAAADIAAVLDLKVFAGRECANPVLRIRSCP